MYDERTKKKQEKIEKYGLSVMARVEKNRNLARTKESIKLSRNKPVPGFT